MRRVQAAPLLVAAVLVSAEHSDRRGIYIPQAGHIYLAILCPIVNHRPCVSQSAFACATDPSQVSGGARGEGGDGGNMVVLVAQ